MDIKQCDKCKTYHIHDDVCLECEKSEDLRTLDDINKTEECHTIMCDKDNEKYLK